MDIETTLLLDDETIALILAPEERENLPFREHPNVLRNMLLLALNDTASRRCVSYRWTLWAKDVTPWSYSDGFVNVDAVLINGVADVRAHFARSIKAWDPSLRGVVG